MAATIFGRLEFGRLVRRYHKKTSTNLGPDVMAMKN
jgi:hypothetical protein